jgi:hypothetical protein
VSELKQGTRKKARLTLTRPEPTIINNCKDWKLIVDKMPKRSFQNSNKNFMHHLPATWVDHTQG